MNTVKIILADWEGYPLFRERYICEKYLKFGIGNLFQHISKHQAGIDFELLLIITELNLNQFAGFKKLLVSNSFTKKVFLEKELRQRQAQHQNKVKEYQQLMPNYPFIKELFFRENVGQDFGSYNYGYQYLKENNYNRDIIFLNASIEGPFEDNWIKKYYDMFHKYDDVGLCSISLHSHNTNLKSRPFAPHGSSNLLYTNMNVLNKVFPKDLCGAFTTDKNVIANEGEVRFSQEILNAGFSICCTKHDDVFYKKGEEWTIPWGQLPSFREI